MSRGVSFQYERALTPIGFVWIPVARVKITHLTSSLELDMIVDTGADLTMIPLLVGWNLGLRRESSRVVTLSGITGATPYILKRLNIEIGPFKLSARVAWAQSDEVPMLMGRTDVLDQLVTVFDGRRRRMTFRR